MFENKRGVWPSSIKQHYGDFVAKTSASAHIKSFGGVRYWSDGTYSSSALAYLSGDRMHIYSGDTGDGVYRILPEGETSPIDVYCKMEDTGQGVGWMLLMITREGATDLSYDDPAWPSFSPKNESLGNINPVMNTSINVLTSVATKLKINEMWIQSTVSSVVYDTRLGCASADYFSNISSMAIISKPSGWYGPSTTFYKNISVDRYYDDYWVRFGYAYGINAYDAWGCGLGIKHVGTGHVNHKSSTAAFEYDLSYGESGNLTKNANVWVK